MNAGFKPPRIIAPPKLDARDDRELTFHLTMLAFCSLVVIASCVFQLDGISRVVLPGTDIAVPGVCWFRRWLNINCPGCGLTRSFISLAHGRWMDAWYFNAAGPLLFVLVVLQIPYQCGQLWRRRRGRPAWRLGRYATVPVVVFAGALFAQWLVQLCAQFLS